MTTDTETKRFVAPTMTRALELVRDEMGPEAIILSSQKVDGGVEIITSVERDLPTRGISERRSFGQNFDAEMDQAMVSDSSWQSQAGIEQAAASYAGQVELNEPSARGTRPIGEDIALEIERARERMIAAKKVAAGEPVADLVSVRKHTAAAPVSMPASPSVTAIDGDSERKLEGLRGELADLRLLLEQQMWSRPVPTTQPHIDEPEAVSILRDHLSRLGLSETLSEDLVKQADTSGRLSDVWKRTLASLARRVPISQNLNTNSGGTFAFVGPTGVGKTTTIAKLAAQYTLAHGVGKVALVSMDTHRVGAIEQLRALGRILDAPVRCVDENHSLVSTLASLKEFPLVLVDTAGFRHGDPKLRRQLAQLDEVPAVKRALVLSSLSQLQTLKASIHAYRSQKAVDACVLTKLDEAASLGEALSAVIEHAIPVAYVTDGQQVPDDIRAASGHDLIASSIKLAKQYAIDRQVTG